MIIKKPLRNSKPIGRDFQFNDPTTKSSKKHYWNYGQGNLGFLTTEQLQTLRKLKLRDIRSNLSTYGEHATTVKNASVCNLKVPFSENERRNSRSQRNLDIIKLVPSSAPNVQQAQTINPKQSGRQFFKRYKSDLQEHKSQAQQVYESIEKQKSRLRNLMKPAGRQSQLYRKLNDSRKMMLREDLVNEFNPQEGIDEQQKEKKRSSLKDEQVDSNLLGVNKRKSEMKLKSGLVNIARQRQNSLKQQQQSENKGKYMRIQTEPSYQNNISQKQAIPFPENHEMELMVSNSGNQQKQALYKSKKYIHPSNYLKRFKRDHSPTFCNSIDYPLSYYRHV